MKKFLGVLLVLVFAINVNVKAADFSTPQKIRCTCYTSTEGSVTASGEPVRVGIVAGKREWMGKTAVLYNMDMELIGIFEFKDTGAGIDTDGDGKGDSIKNGKSIDVYMDTMEDCRRWIRQFGDYVYLEIIEGAEG